MTRAPASVLLAVLLPLATAASGGRQVQDGIAMDVAGDAFGGVQSVRGPDHRVDASCRFHVAAAKAPGGAAATTLLVELQRIVPRGKSIGVLPVVTFRGGVRAPVAVQRSVLGCNRRACGYRDVLAVRLDPAAIARRAAGATLELRVTARPDRPRTLSVPTAEIVAARKLAARLAG